MCSAFPQFPFYQSLIELKAHKKHGTESQQKDISPCFPVPYTSRSSENNENQAAPFCSAQLPEISLEPDKPGYRKTQVKVKMASARMLWNLGMVIFSHHLLLYDKLLCDPGV